MKVLAADLLARRAKELIEVLAFGGWEPAVRLRDALQCYEEVRCGNAVIEASDPQAMSIADWTPAPITQRSEVRS